MPFSWKEAIDELAARRARAMALGGPEAVAKQHAKGKQTARERLDQLLDAGSFQEVGTLAMYHREDAFGNPMEPKPASFICGLARVDGRPVAVGANDYTVSGGTTTAVYLHRGKGETGGFIDDMAYEYKLPMLMLLEGVGAGTAPGKSFGTLPGAAEPVYPGAVYYRAIQLMSEVPCLTAILGPTAGYAAARAVLAHFTVMVKDQACVFMSGPPVVRRALGYEIDMFDLGGYQVHTRNGGVDNVADDEADAIRQIQTVLGFLPQNVWSLPPARPNDDPPDRRCDEVMSIIPENRKRAYDMRKIINAIFDRDSFFEIGRDWGRAVIQGLARIGGYPVGVVANNCMHLGGALDSQANDKQSRFMDFCNTFHVPIIYLVDNPGFMIGREAEREGVARAAMRAVQSVQFADVPVVTLHVRKAYGLGPYAMTNPARLGLRLAWPCADWGGFPAEGGVDAMFRRQVEEAADPAEMRRKAEEFLNTMTSPWPTAEHFAVEEIIHPGETRQVIYRFIEASREGMIARLGPPAHRPRI